MFGFGKARKEAAQVGEAAARIAVMPFWDMSIRAFDARIEAAVPDLLAHSPAIGAARTFAELHGIVSEAIGWRERIGDLAVYDVAERIGWRLGLEPEAVYLHAGTREGAQALDLKARGARLEMTDLPLELRALKPAEVEDILCIYKNDLWRFRVLASGRRPG